MTSESCFLPHAACYGLWISVEAFGQGNQRGQDPRGAPLGCTCKHRYMEKAGDAKAKQSSQERRKVAALHCMAVAWSKSETCHAKSHSLTPTYTQQSRAQQVQLYSAHPTCAPCGQQQHQTTTLSRMSFFLTQHSSPPPTRQAGPPVQKGSVSSQPRAREDEAQQYL